MPVTRAEAAKSATPRALKFAVNLLLLGLLAWFLVAHQQTIRAGAAQRDSIAYWAAGKLLVHHQNPYSAPDVLELQRSGGYAGAKPLMMRPMPWSLWLFLPIGLLNVYWGWLVWTLLLFMSLVLSIRISWQIYGDASQPPSAFFLSAYLFAPVAGCLVGGAMGLVLSLGFCLFLWLEQRHSFWAGVALLIPFSKPHLLALFWPILLVWALKRKKWNLLAGLGSAFAAAILIALAFDPHILEHYRQMMHQQAIQNEFIPALSGMIRAIFFHRFFWVQFVPLGLGLVWSIWHYWKNRESWDWRVHGPAVLIVSLLTTPYAWMSDEAVLLPAILQSVLWLQSTQLKRPSQALILLFVLLDFLLLLMLAFKVPPSTGIYFWSSLVWFGWYWFARRVAAIAAPFNRPSTPAFRL